MRILPLLFACLALATPLRAEVPRVAVDIAPLHSLVARVMQGVGTPDLILPPGASPHDHALRPSEAGALREADLVVFTSEALAPWLEGPLAALAGKARLIEVMALESTHSLPAREGALFGGEAEEDGHGHDHGESGVDPHGWLDPENAASWLVAIARGLSEIDPDNAETYRTNARMGAEELAEMSADITTTLAGLDQRSFIAYHDAFQYFEDRFDLHAAGALTPADDTAPGPVRAAAIRDLAQQEGIACVFGEPGSSEGLVQNILPDSARLVTLDAMGSSLEPGPDLYPRMMRALADAAATCLGSRD